jgi:hypothetical protein
MKTAKGKVLKFRPRSKRKPKPLRPLPRPIPPNQGHHFLEK